MHLKAAVTGMGCDDCVSQVVVRDIEEVESVLRKQPHLKRSINHWKAKVTTNNTSDMKDSSCVS